MRRRPWLGVVVSVTVHAAAVALVAVAVTRDDWLPPLVVDLREGFVPGVADTRRGGGAPATPAPGSPARRARTASRESTRAAARSSAAPAAPEMPPTPEPPAVTAAPPAPPATPEIRPSPEVRRAEPSPDVVRRPEPSSPVVSAPVDTPAAAPVTGESRPAAAVPGGGAGRAEPGDTSRGGDATAAGTGGASASSHRAGGSSFGGGAGTQTALALPGGGSGVGTEYGPYLTALRQRIQQSVRYPASARRRGISGTVDLEILILPNGLVGGVQVVESSTHQILDEAALESVRALPRMPLPRDLPQRALRVRVPVVFQIQ